MIKDQLKKMVKAFFNNSLVKMDEESRVELGRPLSEMIVEDLKELIHLFPFTNDQKETILAACQLIEFQSPALRNMNLLVGALAAQGYIVDKNTSTSISELLH